MSALGNAATDGVTPPGVAADAAARGPAFRGPAANGHGSGHGNGSGNGSGNGERPAVKNPSDPGRRMEFVNGELEALRAWIWDRCGAAELRYLWRIADEERRPLADVIFDPAPKHPHVAQIVTPLGETPGDRLRAWAAYAKEFRRLGLKTLWCDELAASSAAATSNGPALADSPALDALRRALRRLQDGSPSATPGFFLRGPWAEVNGARRLAVCGTRSATPEGMVQSRTLGRRAAAEGWTCVHGGARGADEACAVAMMESGGRQIVVPGEGLVAALTRHPLRHLLGTALLVSAQPPSAEAHRGSLIQRNMIIAALGEALVVVQTAARGGSWHTVRAARDFNLPVFTFEREMRRASSGELPAPVYEPQRAFDHLDEPAVSEGRRRLVAGGAQMISRQWLATCPPDILVARLFERRTVTEEDIIGRFRAAFGLEQDLFRDGPASGTAA